MVTLSKLDGTTWQGSSELWLDPLGDEVSRSDCTLRVDGKVVSYTWSREGKSHQGTITLREGGAVFHDTFHASDPMDFDLVADRPGLFQLYGTYGPDNDWGWRMNLCQRPRSPNDRAGELVLQMTNIAPWGEETRAVRMTLQRA